jgi:hypothetical protein
LTYCSTNRKYGFCQLCKPFGERCQNLKNTWVRYLSVQLSF